MNYFDIFYLKTMITYAYYRSNRSASNNSRGWHTTFGDTESVSTATEQVIICDCTYYSVLVSVSCPKALYRLGSDNIFRITLVVADWLG